MAPSYVPLGQLARAFNYIDGDLTWGLTIWLYAVCELTKGVIIVKDFFKKLFRRFHILNFVNYYNDNIKFNNT